MAPRWLACLSGWTTTPFAETENRSGVEPGWRSVVSSVFDILRCETFDSPAERQAGNWIIGSWRQSQVKEINYRPIIIQMVIGVIEVAQGKVTK